MEIHNYFNQSKVKPSGEDFYKCNAIMSQIQDLAPSDSCVRAAINKLEDGTHRAIISIKAVQGDFIAEALQSDLVQSLNQAREGILDRLTEWKFRRFKSAEM